MGSGIYSDDEINHLVKDVLATQATHYSVEQRRDATRRVLGSLQNSASLKSNDALLHAVLALKTLGRTPTGTEDLASEQGLRTLVALTQLTEPIFQDILLHDLPPLVNEAIRCLANVCLLQEPARVRLASFANVPEAILKAGQSSAPPNTRFLAARLLFLLTASGGDVVRKLVQELSISAFLAKQLFLNVDDISGNSNERLQYDILIEYLKVTFNITLFYPRTANIALCNRSSSSTSPTLLSSPRMASSAGSDGSRSRSPSPSTEKSPTSKGGRSTPELSSNMEKKNSKTGKIKDMFTRKPSTPPKAKQSSLLQVDGDTLQPWGFEEVVSSLVHLALCIPFEQQPGPFGVYKHVITALLNVDCSAYSSTVFARLSPESAPTIGSLPATSSRHEHPSLPPLIARLLSLLSITAESYIPYGPDDDDARQLSAHASEPLDECLSFLILLLAKCAAEDEEGAVRRALKQCLLADDIDRTVGLEKRTDLTGRLIRLMSSTYMPSCNDAAGKLLFCLCEQDPSLFAGTLGYGNASGFLQSINKLIPPSVVPSTSTSSADPAVPSVNPITGAYEAPPKDDEPQMTNEEKEREAERLFVLFDRLNKNGTITVDNPVIAAKAKGGLETSKEEDDAERQRLQDEEDEDERQAIDEIKRYKARKYQA